MTTFTFFQDFKMINVWDGQINIILTQVCNQLCDCPLGLPKYRPTLK